MINIIIAKELTMISLLTKRAFVKSYTRFNLIQMVIIQWAITAPWIPHSRFGILGLSVNICIVAYLVIFYTYYKVFPRKKLKRAWVPYLLHVTGVYLFIVSENNWHFSIVTIDHYLLLGWLMPLCGVCLLVIMFLYYRLNVKRKLLRIVRLTFSGAIFKKII